MAQERFLDYEAPESTALLNGKWLEAEGEYVARGLNVTTSVDGLWKVDISPGAAVVDGVAIVEDEELQGEVTLTTADPDHPRYDIIVLQYEYEQLQSGGTPPAGEFISRKGLATADPTPPEPGANEIKIADVYIPAGSTELHDNNISNMAKWTKGVSEVYTQGEIADKQFSEDGMKQALLNYEGLFTYGELTDRPEPWRYPGIVYLCTDIGVAFYSDGTSWQYKSTQWSAGTEAERPPAQSTHQFYVRLNDARTEVLSLDWSDGDSWHRASLGEGDYAEVGHGNEDHGPTFLTASGTHGNAQHNPDFAEAPHGDDAHELDYSETGHSHQLGELSDVTASGEGDGNGLNADELDGHDWSDVPGDGDVLPASHDNSQHTEDYLTSCTITEQYTASQLGQITATPHLDAPVEVDTDATVKAVKVIAREAPSSTVTVGITVDGSLVGGNSFSQQVDLQSGSKATTNEANEGVELSAGTRIDFSIDDSDTDGSGLRAMLLVEETVS